MQIYDLQNIKWSNQKGSNTNGILLKTQINNKYLKLGSFSGEFFYNREPLFEVLSSRVGQQLNLNFLKYDLISVKININENQIVTEASISTEYKNNEKAIPIEKFIQNKEGWITKLKTVGLLNDFKNIVIFDYIICNMDRHGKNIEVLLNDKGKYRLAPAFDNSFTVLTYRYTQMLNKEFENYRYNEDTKVNNYLGYRTLEANLKIFKPLPKLKYLNREELFQGLGKTTTRTFRNNYFKFINERIKKYNEITNLL